MFENLVNGVEHCSLSNYYLNVFGFQNSLFWTIYLGVLNMLSNLFFDLSTRLFFEDVKICDFGQLWTVLLTLSDEFFIKYDLKRPVNGLWGHTFHS